MGAKLAALGATVHAVAAIEVEELAAPPGLAVALSRLSAYDLLVFTSANGVRFFLPHLAAVAVLPASAPPALCVGPRTAAAWEKAGGRVAGVPARFTGEELAALLPDAEGMDLLILRPETVATDTAGLLRARGARVDEAVLYRTASGGAGGESLRSLLRAGGVQVLTALSPSAVAGLIELAGGTTLLLDLPLLCIGPRTAEAARAAGLTRVHFPSVHTVEGMIEELVKGETT
jgi:uroporphyrinogen-III synthase